MTELEQARSTDIDSENLSDIVGFCDYLTIRRGLSGNTAQAYRADLNHLVRFLGEDGPSLRGATLSHLRRWLAQMSEGGLSRATVARRSASARTFYEWALSTSKVTESPASRLMSPSVPRHLPTVLKQDSATALMEAAREAALRGRPEHVRNWAAVELLYATGSRVGELEKIDVGDIDFDSNTVRLRGKGDRVRVIPFGAPAALSLVQWLTAARPKLASDPQQTALFLGRHGHRWGQRQIRETVHQLCRDAGVPDLAPHGLRHSAATHLIEGGADIRSVQEVLGHTNLATTQRYTHVSAEHMRQSLNLAHPRA